MRLDEKPLPPHQLSAKFAKAALRDMPGAESVVDMIEGGHRNLADALPLDVRLQSNWKGCYEPGALDANDKIYADEVKKQWMDGPDEFFAVWPPRLIPCNSVLQDDKWRGTTDPSSGDDPVNSHVFMDELGGMQLCTARQFAKVSAVIDLASAAELPRPPDCAEDLRRVSTIHDDPRAHMWWLDLSAAYRQLLHHSTMLYWCQKRWRGKHYTDLRCMFGDRSMVLRFQDVSNSMVWVAERCAASPGHERSVLLAAQPTKQARDEIEECFAVVDTPASSPPEVQWRRDRCEAGLEGRHLLPQCIFAYIDDFLGCACGRRRAHAHMYIQRAVHRAFGFPGRELAPGEFFSSKDGPPSRALTALGVHIALEGPLKGQSVSARRAQKYRTRVLDFQRRRSADLDDFRSLACQLCNASQQHPHGRPWLVAVFTAMSKAVKKGSKRVFLGPGVRAELEYWARALEISSGIALFPAEHFPPAGDEVLAFQFDASSEIGYGAVMIFVDKDSGEQSCAYFMERWTPEQTFHINVKEAFTGSAALRTFHPFAQSDKFLGMLPSQVKYVSPGGDNMTANANHRKNSCKSLLTAECLRESAEYIARHSIVSRPCYVNTKENLSDPLSRDDIVEFMKRMRERGVTKFLELKVHPSVRRLLQRITALWQELGGDEPAPAVPAAPRELSGSRATPTDWYFIHNFCGADAGVPAFAPLGGKPLCASEIDDLAARIWQARTGAQCFRDFYMVREMVADGTWPPELAQRIPQLLAYLAGAPCIDFSNAGKSLGLAGQTGQLFLDDCDCAVRSRAPVIIKEIVTGILRDHLVHVLHAAVAALEDGGRYVVSWKICRVCRFGDDETSRERVFIVAVRRDWLPSKTDWDQSVAQNLFFPAERPPRRVGMEHLLREHGVPEQYYLSADLFNSIQWLPEREVSDTWDGLILEGKVHGSDAIGHHVYSTKGAIATQRTWGDGPGLSTGLYTADRCSVFRLPPEVVFAAHHFPCDFCQCAREHGATDDDLYKMGGNSIPVNTLQTIMRHILRLLVFPPSAPATEE